jgi:NADPH:quinone reductase-like Zn-dependent oxidoreductase
MATMKAMRFHSYGDPGVLVLEKVPRPEAGAGEVLIQVYAAGVNPLDWKVRAGYVREWLPHRLPLIPGWDVAGIVAAVGPGVTDYQVGDEVYGMLDFGRDGAYAEYVAARAGDLMFRPKTIDHVQGAAVPLAALTAWQALFEVGNLTPWHSVLIHGAAGGVGHFAVQFAKWKGARVLGTASGDHVSYLKDLGADVAIDYRTTRFEEVAKEVDVVLDTIGGETQQRSWQVLKRGGILVATLGISDPEGAQRYEVRGEGVMVHSDATDLTLIGALIYAEEALPTISTVLPLAEAARAHELSQAGHVKGKIVLKVRD